MSRGRGASPEKGQEVPLAPFSRREGTVPWPRFLAGGKFGSHLPAQEGTLSQDYVYIGGEETP